MDQRNRLVSILTAVVMLATPALAADNGKESPFTIEFSAGAEYDSNVAVLELDTSSGEGDIAALLDFGLGFDTTLTDWFELKLGYDFSQTLHDEFDTFDLRIHRGSGELAFDLGPIDAGLGYQYADAALDGDGFLTLERYAPYVSRLFGKRLFMRAEYARSDKEFAAGPSRDATTDAWSLDTFVFLDGVKHYLIFGVQTQDEDAIDDQFDYDGTKLKAQLSRRFGQGRGIKLKAGLRHETRDYSAALLPGSEPREDERFGFEAELAWPLAERGFLRTRYEYNDNRSTLASVDFDEHVVSIEVGGKF